MPKCAFVLCLPIIETEASTACKQCREVGKSCSPRPSTTPCGVVHLGMKRVARGLGPITRILKHGSSLANSSSGERLATGKVAREVLKPMQQASLPTVIAPPADAGLPAPLIVKSRGLFGTRVTYDNPWAPGVTDKGFKDFSKLARSGEMGAVPTEQEIRQDLPLAEVELDEIAKHDKDSPMRVTWIGHATLLIQIDGLNILTDPMFSERASASQWVGPKRFVPAAMAVADLPRIDVVLLSHNHYDHLDTGSVKAIGNAPLWVVPSGLGGFMGSVGIENCVELSWWEEVEVDGLSGSAVRLASTPAQHWSTRMVWDRNRSLWCGFAVIGSRERFYFAGDTAYCPIFGLIGERYGPFDLAAIPIGAHEPAWFMKEQHCSPAEALTIHKEIGTKRSFAVHWGTFPLAADRHADAPRELVAAQRASGVKSSEFSIVRHGESIVTDGSSRRYKCLFGGDDL